MAENQGGSADGKAGAASGAPAGVLTAQQLEELQQTILGTMIKWQRRILRGAEVLSSPLEIEVGATSYETLHKRDRVELRLYKSTAKQPLATPTILVYALVNRYYMMDLQADRSMFKVFLDAGLDMYVIDWGYPTRGDKFLTMTDYIEDYIDHMVDEVRRRTGQPQVNLMGICQGGTFSAIYAALHPEKIRNLVTIVAPIDFDTDTGLLNVWARRMNVDQMVDTFGNIPGEFLNVGFLMLNPVRLMFDKYVSFLENLDDANFVANFLRMEKWIFDSPDQVGEAFRQFLKDLYQQNKLVKGELEIGGRKVDLKNITMPVLNAFAEADHLVPPACSRRFTELTSSKDTEVLAYPTGHIGMFTSRRSQTEYTPRMAAWLAERSGGRAAAADGPVEASGKGARRRGGKE
ncbi:MAG: class III poly(R)-hydroxyalkanoic acid synthase subunit PhaC [Deltaproteobacteria bacterium]|nr:class III poly(R)-hydroxyalkanoic acid synthase subunit PhaC [Deltaproteobacteria bacterium]